MHRAVIVGVQILCLTVWLWGTGCGERTAGLPSTDTRIYDSGETAAARTSTAVPDARPADPAVFIASEPVAARAFTQLPDVTPVERTDFVPANSPDENVVPVQYIAPVTEREPAVIALQFERRQLHRAIGLAVQYLVRVCGEDGKFVYLAHRDPAVQLPPEYNVLRHAGTIFAMGMYGAWRSDDAVEAAMLRAGGFLKTQAVAPVKDRPDLLAVWSQPDLDPSAKFVEAKLGGAGLGLVALTAVERLRPGATPLEELRGLGRFLLYMQEPDGRFITKYVPSQGGRNDGWSSLYYPGEAALGLLKLYEVDPQPPWRQGAELALKYLARFRRDRRTVEPDQWALLATAQLFELAKREAWDIDRAALTYHAAQICQRMLDDAPRYVPFSEMAGCLTDDLGTCPTAARLEGLIAIVPWLTPEYPELCSRLRPAMDAAIAYLVRAQVQSGSHAGGMPRCITVGIGEKERTGEIRIDYVQHALSAMIQYDTFRFGAD